MLRGICTLEGAIVSKCVFGGTPEEEARCSVVAEFRGKELGAESCPNWQPDPRVPLLAKPSEAQRLRAALRDVRELIWNKDVPHPTTPDLREWHENCQKFMKFIDSALAAKEGE